jgi:hypothetical protein
MTDKPIRASDVAAESDKSQDELKRERARREAHARVAKRRAMRKVAPDEVPPSSDDLAARIEFGLRAREAKIRGKPSKQTVSKAVAAKRAARERQT